MKVLFLTLFPEIGASSRYRVYQFIPYLERQGIICKTSTLISEKYFKLGYGFIKYPKVIQTIYKLIQPISSLIKRTVDVLRAKKYDVIFIQKDILPGLLQKLLKFMNPNIVYEFDDAIFVRHPGQKGITGKLLEIRRKKLPGMINISKHIIAENDYTKSYALKYNPNVSVITGPIDTERFFVKDKTNGNMVVIGWIGNPDGTPIIESIQDVFERLGKGFPNAVLKLIGASKIQFKNIQTICKDWSLDTEVEELQSFDIGIGPMPDDEWTRGKGGTKLLQYMSCGLPVVASPVEIQKEIVIDGKTGFLATTNDEWYEKLKILIKDKQLREEMGKAGRKRAEEIYSLKKAVPKLIKIFETIRHG